MIVFSKKHSKKPDFIEDFDVFATKEWHIPENKSNVNVN